MPPSAAEFAVPSWEELRRVAADPEKAMSSLPEEEQLAYREAQDSVVDARRSAESHEGLLQIN
jgi:hypothetical protein